MTATQARPQTLLVASITEPDPPLEAQVQTCLAAGADLVELRVDCIRDEAAVERLLARSTQRRFILTVRSAEEGGHWDASESERIALIERLGLLQPGFIDVELATWLRSANVRQKLALVCQTGGEGAELDAAGPIARPRNRLILSYHDWQQTPADPDAILDRFAPTPAGVIKLAWMAEDACDGLRALELLRRRGGERPLAVLAMGEGGIAARVLAGRFGGYLTYAAARRGAESAPGQPTLAEVIGLYRWGERSPDPDVYGVIGWPVTHSRSPHVHNAALREAGIDAVYVPLPVRPEQEAFRRFIEYVCANDWLGMRGFSVTLPHKEHAWRWLCDRGGRLSPPAAKCRAVNTLTREADGRWSGDNTDGDGAVAALADALGEQGRLAGLRVEVLGAGGAARAVVAALLDRGACVVVTNRTAGRAERLADELGCQTRAWAQRGEGPLDVIVNCTSVGMEPRSDETPLPAQRLAAGMIVLDTVYTPRQTRLLREAAERGCVTVAGTEMFVRQAAAQFRRWHGCGAPLAAMRAALEVSL